MEGVLEPPGPPPLCYAHIARTEKVKSCATDRVRIVVVEVAVADDLHNLFTAQ